MLRLRQQADPEDLSCLYNSCHPFRAYPLHRLGKELPTTVRTSCLEIRHSDTDTTLITILEQ